MPMSGALWEDARLGKADGPDHHTEGSPASLNLPRLLRAVYPSCDVPSILVHPYPGLSLSLLLSLFICMCSVVSP